MGLSIESATTAELTKASVCLFRAKFRLPYGCQLHKEYDLKYWQIEAARAAIVRHMERQK